MMKLKFKFKAGSPDTGLAVESPIESWTVDPKLEATLKPLIKALDHIDSLPDNGQLDLTTKVMVPVKFKWLFLTFNRTVELDLSAVISVE